MYGKVFVTICKKNHVDISIRAGEAHSLVFVPLTWSAYDYYYYKTHENVDIKSEIAKEISSTLMKSEIAKNSVLHL